MKKLCNIRYHISKKREIHGMTKTKEYQTWASMRNRVKYNYKANKLYFNRIKVSKSWNNSFLNFFKDMGYAPSKKHSLDRIDNNGDYCKENCRWATNIEQSNNRSSNILIKYKNKEYTLLQLCNLLKLPYSTIRARIKNYNWSIEKAINEPILKNYIFSKNDIRKIRNLYFKNKVKQTQISKLYNVDSSTISRLISKTNEKM